MEISLGIHENQNPSVIPSPNSHSPNSSSSSTSSTSQSNGHQQQQHRQQHPSPPTPQPLPPVLSTRSEPNSPYPTTFVQADTSSFKQMVQMLTGSSETAKLSSGSGRSEYGPIKSHSIPPIKNGTKKEKSTSKLYERRNSMKKFKLSPLAPGFVTRTGFPDPYTGSPRITAPEMLSPSLLDFPSLVLSPVTPLIPDPFNRSPHSRGSSIGSNLDVEAEDKAIAKKGFFFHPSPASTPRDAKPILLPLFPVTSPKVSGVDS